MSEVEVQKNNGPKKKQGTPNPLNIEWTRNAQVAEKCEKNPGIHVLPIGFNSGWYGGNLMQRTLYIAMIVSARYLIPVICTYSFAANAQSFKTRFPAVLPN